MKSGDSFVSSPSDDSPSSQETHDGVTVHSAALNGDFKSLDTIFRKGADINGLVADGSTALHIASYYGHADCVKFLLKHGARWDIKDRHGNMAVHLAAKKNHIPVIEMLVKYGTYVSDGGTGVGAWDAGGAGAHSLLDARGGTGLCPVHTAAKYGLEAMLEFLLKSGARADRYTDSDNPQHALHLAASRGHAECVSIILRYNEGFTEPRDAHGRTPLYLGVLRNHPNVVLILVLAKAVANAADNSGKLPLQIAVDHGYDDVCHSLCEHGGDVSLRYSYPRKEAPDQFNMDRYGQIKKREKEGTDILDSISAVGGQARALECELACTKQWERMLKRWSKYTHDKKDVVRNRVAKGIPDSMRGQVWMKLCGYEKSIDAAKYRTMRVQDSVWAHQIDLDVSRAFRNHAQYHTRYGKGQCALFHVLKAYSIFDKDLGYCQGMGDMAGLLLKYFSEREAFSMYDIVMREPKYNMRGCFLNDFPKLQRTFYVHGKLLECISPQLANHLRAQGAVTPLYATRWYLTVFLDIFSFDMTLRVWDLFFMDGYDILYSVSIAILKIYEEELLGLQFDKIMMFMHTLGERRIDCDEFITYVIEHRISTKTIRRLESAYEEYGDVEGVHTMTVHK